MTEFRITGAWRPTSSGDARRHILVVEDSLVQRLSLRLLLDGYGYEVSEAATGAEADAAMRTAPPDAVLLDWELPDATGPELLARWVADSELRWIPVLMLTGHDQAEKVRDALDAGAADFLRKPPNGVELHARLRNALRLKDLQEQMLHLAQRDALTGLWNRHVALDRLGRLLRGAGSAPALRVAVALIDIDHFKRVNDTFGHDAGDAVLVAVAALLERELGPRGSVCRFGGEEFLAIVPDLDGAEAAALVEATRRTLAATPIPLPGATSPADALEVDFSAGVAAAECGGGVGVSALVKQADVALYQAKAQGRGQVVRTGAARSA